MSSAVSKHTSECGSSWMHVEKRFVLPRTHIPDTVSDASKVPREGETRLKKWYVQAYPYGEIRNWH